MSNGHGRSVQGREPRRWVSGCGQWLQTGRPRALRAPGGRGPLGLRGGRTGPAPGVLCSVGRRCMDRLSRFPALRPLPGQGTPRAGDRTGGKYVVFVIPARQTQRAPCVAGGRRLCRPRGHQTDAHSVVQTQPGPRNSEFTGKNHGCKRHFCRLDEDRGLSAKFNLPETFLLK